MLNIYNVKETRRLKNKSSDETEYMMNKNPQPTEKSTPSEGYI